MEQIKLKLETCLDIKDIFNQLEWKRRFPNDLSMLVYRFLTLEFKTMIELNLSPNLVGRFFLANTDYHSNGNQDQKNQVGFTSIGESVLKSIRMSDVNGFIDNLPLYGYGLSNDGSKIHIYFKELKSLLLEKFYANDEDRLTNHAEFFGNLKTSTSLNNSRYLTSPKMFRYMLQKYSEDFLQLFVDSLFFGNFPLLVYYNRQDLFQLIVEFNQTTPTSKSTYYLNMLFATNFVSHYRSRFLWNLVNYGRFEFANYFTKIAVELAGSQSIYKGLVSIINRQERDKILQYLYKPQVNGMMFDIDAVKGRIEDVIFLYEHGCRGKNAVEQLEGLDELSPEQEQVLNFLKAHEDWNETGKVPDFASEFEVV